MEDNFDNEFKKHGDAYKVQPREWVWPRVEAELEKEQDRRIAAWWWMLPLFLLMLGGGYLLIGTKKTGSNPALSTITITVDEKAESSEAVVQPSEKNTEVSTNPSTEKIKITSKPTTKENTATAATDLNYQREIAATKASTFTKTYKKDNTLIEKENDTNTVALFNKKTNGFATTKATIQTRAVKLTSTDLAVLNPTERVEKENSQKAVFDIEKEAIVSSGEQVTAIKDTEAIPSEKSPTKQIIINTNTKDSTTTKSIETDIVQKDADSAIIKTATAKENGIPNIAPKAKRPFKKETVWTINAGIGIANNKNGAGLSKLFNAQPLSYADYVQNGPTTGSNGGCVACNVTAGPIMSNKPSITLSVSVERSQWIAKRWQWKAELGWQYQQIQQRTGNRKDSVISSSSFSSQIYNYYYQSGSSNNHNGYNHRVFLSNQLAFAVLKNRKLLLSAGIFGGMNIGNNYLVPDKSNWRFVDGKNLYKNGFVGGEIGLTYSLRNNWFIGLNGKSDFTRSFTPPDGNNQYWKSWQLQAGIPLSNIKHLFKK